MLTPTVSHVPVLVNDLEECTFTRLHLGKGIEVGEGVKCGKLTTV